MSDFDRLLGDSLKAVAEDFRPDDLGAAQREFMTRRKRRFTWQLVGGVAVAGAAVAAILFAVANQPLVQHEGIPTQREPEGTVVVDVGVEPRSVAATSSDGVWVTNSGDGTVARIDPADGSTESIEIGGTPDEIIEADGRLWVSDEANGTIWIIDPVVMDVVDSFTLTDSVGAKVTGRLDLAFGDGSLFVANPSSGHVFLVDPADPSAKPFQFDSEGELFSDVTGDDDEAWALGPTGDLRQLDLKAQTNRNRASFDHLRAYEVGPNADLLLAGEGLWASGNGKIRFIDLASGDHHDISVDGDYADMSFDGTNVWALAGRGDDESGLLYRFDLSGRQGGKPIALDGHPVDVSGAAGKVWVAQAHAGTVTGIPTTGILPLPSESPSAEPTEAPNAKAKSTVMVFSKDGDIYAAYGDGTIEALTSGAPADTDPVFVRNTANPAYPAVLFARAEGDSQLYYLDLKTLEEQPISQGERPSCLGADCTWIGSGPGAPLVVNGVLFSEPSTTFSIPGAGHAGGIDAVVRDADGRLIYAVVVDEPAKIARFDSVEKPYEAGGFSSPDSRAFYALASASEPGSVDVVTPTSDSTAMEIGTVSGWNDNSPRYTTLIGLNDLPFSPRSSLYRLTRADGLSASPNQDGTVTWGPSDATGWIVSDGVRAFLVDTAGGLQELPFEVHNGMDVYEDRSI